MDMLDAVSPATALTEYGSVKLTVPIDREGVVLPSGAQGVIVHDHADGSYSVEFEHPSFEVVTVLGAEMTPAA